MQVNAMAVFGSDHKEPTQTEITQAIDCLNITVEAVNLDADFVYLSMAKYLNSNNEWVDGTTYLETANLKNLEPKLIDVSLDAIDLKDLPDLQDRFFKEFRCNQIITLTEVVKKKFNVDFTESNYNRMSIVYNHPLIPLSQSEKPMYLFDDVPIGYFHSEMHLESRKALWESSFRETILES